MGRLKRPRKAWGRPNFLDPLILFWLDRKGGKGEPRNFPRHWINSNPEKGLPRESKFSRQAVYSGFKRLEEKRLLRRVEGKKICYELVKPDQVYAHIMELWLKVMPLKPALASESRRLHERLKHSLEEAVKKYEKLPSPLKGELKDSIVEDHILNVEVEGAVSTKEMLTLEEADALKEKARDLLGQWRFVGYEKRWKQVPLTSRPPDWKRSGHSPPSLETDAYRPKDALGALPAEHPPCPDCDTGTIFDRQLGVFVCPKCGLEIHQHVL